MPCSQQNMGEKAERKRNLSPCTNGAKGEYSVERVCSERCRCGCHRCCLLRRSHVFPHQNANATKRAGINLLICYRLATNESDSHIHGAPIALHITNSNGYVVIIRCVLFHCNCLFSHKFAVFFHLACSSERLFFLLFMQFFFAAVCVRLAIAVTSLGLPMPSISVESCSKIDERPVENKCSRKPHIIIGECIKTKSHRD